MTEQDLIDVLSEINFNPSKILMRYKAFKSEYNMKVNDYFIQLVLEYIVDKTQKPVADMYKHSISNLIMSTFDMNDVPIKQPLYRLGFDDVMIRTNSLLNINIIDILVDIGLFNRVTNDTQIFAIPSLTLIELRNKAKQEVAESYTFNQFCLENY